jgi:hypothetical protein
MLLKNFAAILNANLAMDLIEKTVHFAELLKYKEETHAAILLARHAQGLLPLNA